MKGGAAMKITEFQAKDVVNIVDGKKLGQIRDVELSIRTGQIEAIILPPNYKWFGWLQTGEERIIPWPNIVKIGVDVILVKLDLPSPAPGEI
jgi:YlmC/YmxH family sporulation protein